jgi:hypothetical protein
MVKRSPKFPTQPTSGGIQYPGPDGEPMTRREYLEYRASQDADEFEETKQSAVAELRAFAKSGGDAVKPAGQDADATPKAKQSKTPTADEATAAARSNRT